MIWDDWILRFLIVWWCILPYALRSIQRCITPQCLGLCLGIQAQTQKVTRRNFERKITEDFYMTQVGIGGAVVALQICRFWAQTSDSHGPAGNITAFSGRNLKKRFFVQLCSWFFQRHAWLSWGKDTTNPDLLRHAIAWIPRKTRYGKQSACAYGGPGHGQLLTTPTYPLFQLHGGFVEASVKVKSLLCNFCCNVTDINWFLGFLHVFTTCLLYQLHSWLVGGTLYSWQSGCNV